jgi:hypothetical protein
MLFLKWGVPIALGLWFVSGALLVDEIDSSLRLDRAVPPVHPGNTVDFGIAVLEIELERAADLLRTRMLYGEAPYMPRALNTVKQWRFSLPPELDSASTSVTFLFRPPAVYSFKPVTTSVRPWTPGQDSPALPQYVIDPGYPATSLASGAVILEVRIDAAGAVAGLETIYGIEPLIAAAKKAVMNWRFSPATIGGKAVASTAFAVISFVTPT